MADKQRYEIIKLLGKGRTGGVYEADDSLLERKVALRRFFSDDENNSKDWEEEFTNISQSLCNLQNPGLLTVFDAGIDDEGPFIISQLVRNGANLPDRLTNSALQEWEAHDLATQLMDTLYSCHQNGFIHGALTPGSIMMVNRARGGHRYIITDLGLARLAPLIQGSNSALSLMADPTLMAPELFEKIAPDEKSDIYMLGQLIYTCLAGGHPYSGMSTEDIASKHKNGEMPAITDYRPDLSPQFISWLNTLLQPDPENRPENILKTAENIPEVERPIPEITNSVGTTPARGTTTQVTLNTGHVATQAQQVDPNTGAIQNTPGSLTQHVSITSSPAVPLQSQASNKSLTITLSCVGAAILAVIVGIVVSSSSDSEQGIANQESESSNDEQKATPSKNTEKSTKTSSDNKIEAFTINVASSTTVRRGFSSELLDFSGDQIQDYGIIINNNSDNWLQAKNNSVFKKISLSFKFEPNPQIYELTKFPFTLGNSTYIPKAISMI